MAANLFQQFYLIWKMRQIFAVFDVVWVFYLLTTAVPSSRSCESLLGTEDASETDEHSSTARKTPEMEMDLSCLFLIVI